MVEVVVFSNRSDQDLVQSMLDVELHIIIGRFIILNSLSNSQLALSICGGFVVGDLLTLLLHLGPPSVMIGGLMIKVVASLSTTAFCAPFADLVPTSDGFLSLGDLPSSCWFDMATSMLETLGCLG